MIEIDPNGVEAAATAIVGAEVGYEMKLSRLVDGVSTYTLKLETGEQFEFGNTDDVYEKIASEKAKRQAEAAITAYLSTVSPPSDGDGRNVRQKRVAEWCAAAFGKDHQSSVPQRGLRMLEEAIEAYQALNGSPDAAHKLIDYIYAKEPGELRQELGGLGVTLLALAEAAGLSADDAEQAELDRVLSKPLAWFHARNQVKNDAGFDATAYPAREVAHD